MQKGAKEVKEGEEDRISYVVKLIVMKDRMTKATCLRQWDGDPRIANDGSSTYTSIFSVSGRGYGSPPALSTPRAQRHINPKMIVHARGAPRDPCGVRIYAKYDFAAPGLSSTAH